MRINRLILFIISALLVVSCSKNDDNNPADSSSSNPANGTYKILKTFSSGNLTYSLTASLNIKINGNSVSGTGTFDYKRTDNGNNTSLSGTDDISGTYNSPSITVRIGTASSSDSFTFTGNWEKENVNFLGTATVKFSGTDYNIDCYLAK